MSSASTSLTRGESNVLMIQAKEYVGITDRASPAARRQVETVLVRLVDGAYVRLRSELTMQPCQLLCTLMSEVR